MTAAALATIERILVVNGDDFGQSRGINSGIIEAYERGILTSTSLMVRWEAAREAADYGRQNPELSIGLHFDIGEWLHTNGAWTALYEVIVSRSESVLLDEIKKQLDAFYSLVGRAPTHVDSHQHVHREEPLRSLLTNVSQELGVPLRSRTPGIQYCGGFYGQMQDGGPLVEAITVDALSSIIGQLKPGITEIGCHPGRDVEPSMVYAQERQCELETLCHPSIRQKIQAEGVELCSFARVAARLPLI